MCIEILCACFIEAVGLSGPFLVEGEEGGVGTVSDDDDDDDVALARWCMPLGLWCVCLLGLNVEGADEHGLALVREVLLSIHSKQWLNW